MLSYLILGSYLRQSFAMGIRDHPILLDLRPISFSFHRLRSIISDRSRHFQSNFILIILILKFLTHPRTPPQSPDFQAY